jgi:hypothetical protein
LAKPMGKLRLLTREQMLRSGSDITQKISKITKGQGRAKPPETGWKPILHCLEADPCDLLFAFPFSASRWKMKGNHVFEGRCVL